MKKYFLIKSIRRNMCPSDEDGWIQYNITPITEVLKGLPKLVAEYNECLKRTVMFEVCGVKGNETAVITLNGPRKRVKEFPTVLSTTNFYEHFSLREVEFPDIYL